MQIVKNPSQAQLNKLFQRPAADSARMEKQVRAILDDVRNNGNAALKKYNLLFDKAALKNLRVSKKEWDGAAVKTDKKLANAIRTAYNNIRNFHRTQRTQEPKTETTKGVVCWRESRPIQEVGLYIPGGSAPLFSTVLMLGVPAQIAGCSRVVLCSPPDKNGNIHPAILFAASLCGIHEIYKVGGAQAIGALAFGTKTIAPVDKIFGPGNQYVTMAKQLVQKEGVAIDMPAGPSEVLVVGDDSAEPSFIAADLLSQAEHGSDSQVIFVSLSETLAQRVKEQLKLQLAALPRKNIAEMALKYSRAMLVKTKEEAVQIVNRYAPEHLILAVKSENYFLKNVHHAGSVFIGNFTPESAGDYASGTNHTLPTNGYARAYSGVSLDSFVKKITYQKITREGIMNLGPVIETLAEAEGLNGHKNAVSIRLKKLKT